MSICIALDTKSIYLFLKYMCILKHQLDPLYRDKCTVKFFFLKSSASFLCHKKCNVQELCGGNTKRRRAPFFIIFLLLLLLSSSSLFCLLCVLLIWPELNISVLTQTSPLDQLSLLPHDVLNRDLPVAKDVQVVRDDVSVAAARACNQDRSLVVALLGDVVLRAAAARLARKRELVVCIVAEWAL